MTRGQETVSRPVTVSGVGLHLGKLATATIHPAAPNAGIVFQRTDLEACENGNCFINATPMAVADAQLGTRLANASGISISTVEHMMAALAICGVDNALITVDGPELPILDGSAEPFVKEIQRVGKLPLAAGRNAFAVTAVTEEKDGDRFVRVEPSSKRILDVTIDFEEEAIGHQRVVIDLDSLEIDEHRLSSARTFCRLGDVEKMRAAGFSLGGSLDNAIVVDGDKLLNEFGLRDPKEFVLHKALDLLGDLYLLGGPILGRITAFKPGHDLNTRCARRLASSCDGEQGHIRLTA